MAEKSYEKNPELADATTPEGTQARVKTNRKGRKKVEGIANQLGKLNVEYVGINDIRPNSYNPNRQSDHDFELLLRSMEDDGFTQPIIVTKDGVIVDGEHRWRAADTLGYTEIPVVKVNMTEEQARVATIRHNRARGSHDIELEADVLRDLEKLGAMDWAKDALMITDAEIHRLLDDIEAPEECANEEFSESWEPDDGVADASTEGRTVESSKGAVTMASTPAALEAARDREKKLAAAKTQEEREKVQQDLKIYRVNLVFTAEQAVVVKEILGEEQAVNLLKLCQEESERRKAG